MIITSRLSRLRAMGRIEMAFRARAAARTQLDRLAAITGPPRWDRDGLPRALASYVLDAPMTEAIGRRDWTVVHRRLEDVLRGRPSRFVLDPATREEVRAAILSRWPGAARDASARAERMVGGEYDLLGYRGLRFTDAAGRIDWHLDPVARRRAPRQFWADVPYLDPAIGDHKVIWELNRHQHWLALGRALWLTGDARYGREIVGQLRSWLADNPPLVGVNWASMLEIGFRSLSWLSAVHLLLGHADDRSETADAADGAGGDWLVDVLLALHHQLEHVARNLSCYFSPNTHLLGEALALYVVGQSLPELARSPHWTDLGRRILLEQIDRQVEPDGGHAERSLHYHRYTHDFYLLALLTAERCGDEDAAGAFRAVAGRMATFLRETAGDSGRLPLIGDDDGGMLWPIGGRDSADVRDSLTLAAAILDRPELAPWGACEEALWLAWTRYRDRLPGSAAVTAPPGGARVAVFPASGYVVVRDATGGQVVFDAGPHGFLNGGHAHADALSMTLAIEGRPLLIDPGTGSYTDASLRDRLRRTANHNTLTIGARSSSIPAGPFHWQSRADARLEVAVANTGFAWIEAAHDGYRDCRHRRSIVQAGGGWLVVDEVIGDGDGEAHVHWHFDPQWTVASESGQALAARHADGAPAWLVHDAPAVLLAFGDDDSGLGWCSPRYGAVVPIWSARLSRRIDGGAVSLVTWIAAATPGEGPPSLERVLPDVRDGGPVVAVRVRGLRTAALTAVRPGAVPPLADRECLAGEYHTDARLLRYTLDAGSGLTSLAMADGTRARSLDDSFVSISADAAIRDLSMQIDGGCLDLRTSTPPPLLRLRGRTLDRIVALRLNGREPTRMRRSDGGDVTLSGDDWPEAPVEPGVDLCVA